MQLNQWGPNAAVQWIAFLLLIQKTKFASGGSAPRIPDVGIRWRWPLYLGEGASGTHWIGNWVGSSAESGRCEEERNILPLSRIKPRFLDRPARSLFTRHSMFG
jgi:hypothetical protein